MEIKLAQNKQKGPSLSALAALITLAISLWLEIDLATALFRSILVYLILSLLLMAYRIVLGRFLAISQAKAEAELLEKIQREAEEEEAKRKEEQEKQEAETQEISQPDAKTTTAEQKNTVPEERKRQKEATEI